MKVSINCLQKLVDETGYKTDLVPHGPENLALKVGAQLGAIDEVIPFPS